MNREEMAARIFIARCTGVDYPNDYTPMWCFEQADRFLAYCAKEQEKEKHREPKTECKHQWGIDLCHKCGAPKVVEYNKGQTRQPEPPKPCPNEGKRLCSHRPEDHEPPAVQELWLYKDYSNQPWTVTETEPKSHWNYKIKVREVLPGGGG